MGQQCGGVCKGSQDEDEISVTKPQAPTFDFDKYEYDTPTRKNVVKIQANYRGKLAREKIKHGEIEKQLLSDEDGLIFVTEIIKEGGSRYRGQLKDDGTERRHGYGE